MKVRYWPFCLLLALATIACAKTTVAPDPNPSQIDITATASRTAGATLRPTTEITRPSDLTMATVTHVVDGDTIDVEINGETKRLRYIGMDTPETVDPNRPVGCYGHEASDYNKQLVLGQTVGLQTDVSETDDFGRLLRYVWLGDVMVNADLVRNGYAVAKAYPPDTEYNDILQQIQAEAKQAGAGLWTACANATPFVSPTQTAPAGSGTQVCDFSGTNQAVIKGNISSSDEKIYHVPGQQSYDETSINERNGERWFCTEADAVAAGWRKSKS
ncbi:MAG: thermonuclease family protein [Chloroflexota bacterium]